MIIVTHLIKPKTIELEVKCEYTNPEELNRRIRLFYSHGFKFNKVRRMWCKVYCSKEYTEDKFHNDIDMLKSLTPYYKITSYKLVNVDTNI